VSKVSCEFQDRGAKFVAEMDCISPGRLESGKLGWFFVSDHIPWRCGWYLRVHCSITIPEGRYGYPKPADGTILFPLKTRSDCAVGSLDVRGRLVRAEFSLPDCFDPPKNFVHGFPILIQDTLHHLQMRLESRPPKPNDGTCVERYPATGDRRAGVRFRQGDNVILSLPDTTTERAGEERFRAKIAELRAERGITSKYIGGMWLEARQYVDNHPEALEDSRGTESPE
jgi:hypothetical protein